MMIMNKKKWQIEKRERYDRGRGPSVQARDKKAQRT
jgi:hypothetical protein